MTDVPRCQRGHPMRVLERFRFDHEPGDTDHIAEQLTAFQAANLELGADVTLWYCDECDFASAAFAYPDHG